MPSASPSPALPMDEQLRFAITHKRLLRLTYHGKTRIGEPHDYGMQRNMAKLLFYQLHQDGQNPPGKPTSGWRMLELPKITACEVLEETFPGSRGSSHRRHLIWDQLLARVE